MKVARSAGLALLPILPALLAGPLAAQAAHADSARDSIRECVLRCLGGEQMPVLTSFPRIDIADIPASSTPSSEHPQGTGNLGQIGMHGSVVYTVVVKTDGTADITTLRVVSNMAKDWDPVLRRALFEARFRPASDARGVARARVELTFEIRAEGLNTLCLRAGVTSTSGAQRPLETCFSGTGG